jgi:thiol-disulfide isomerase/thioredoxin
MRPLYLLPVLVAAMAALAACDPKTDFPAIVALATPPAGPAPAWRLRDPDGNPVSSDQFKGKVVVIDFWATWCVPCRIEIPGYIELQKKYAKDGLVIIGVSVDQEGPAVVKKFMADFGINYPIVMADDDIVNAFGGVDAYPTTYIIDRDGIIRDRKIGSESTAKFEKRILAWLKPGDAAK